MKINLILPGFGASGGVKVALRYANALSSLGHDVVCYAPRVIYDLGKHKRLELLLRRTYRLFFPAGIKEIKAEYPDLRIVMPFCIEDKSIRDADKTIATAWCTAFDVSKLSKAKGEKVYFIQGYEVWDDENKGKESYRLPMKHIVISKWIDDILVRELGCPPGIVVHNGVDTTVFNASQKDISNNKVNVLMLYHKLSVKGVEDGLLAYERLLDKYENIELTMFGQHPFTNRPSFVKEYYFNPTKEELVKLYRKADIFVFPSREEGWGLTPVEAMACGCAVAGSNVGCMIEIGKHGENVLLSEPCDVKQLSENLEALIVDKELRNQISKKGMDTVKQLNWNNSYLAFNDALVN